VCKRRLLLLVFVLEEHSCGWSRGVVELPGPDAPYEDRNETGCEEEGGWESDQNDVHEKVLDRMATSSTVIELAGIRMAPSSGETRPATAREAATAL